MHDTLLVAGNAGDNPTTTALTLVYNGGKGSYTMEKLLQPGQQIWADVGSIIGNQTPDKDGHMISQAVTAGSYEVRDVDNPIQGKVYEGKLILDKTYGHAAYGCGICCGYRWVAFDPSSYSGNVGNSTADHLLAGNSCYAEYDDVTYGGYDWGSSNTAVATVVGGAYTTLVGAGTASGSAYATLPGTNIRQGCPDTGFLATPQSITSKPVITSISPSTILAGSSNVQLTINGSGFGTSPTVNLPSGVTSSGQSATNSTITITVSVAFTATIGNASLTVTANSETSNAVNLVIDGPSYMEVVTDVLAVCSGCTSTLERDTTYQVYNFSKSPSGGSVNGEIFSESGWNCNQQNPGFHITQCPNGGVAFGGKFTDAWSLNSDGFTPAGCGINVTDHWQWCPASRVFGTLTGYAHTNAVDINGFVLPGQPMPSGTKIYP